MWKAFKAQLARWLGLSTEVALPEWQASWSQFLSQHVAFYRHLSLDDQRLFEQRCLLFLATTPVIGGVAVDVTDDDRLLVAASAVIPVWGFPHWHYVNLKGVFLLPSRFNEHFECGGPDALISGMVGTGPMAGKMALSKPDLHLGFNNNRDKHNVGIHEFVHLVDMADGACDGFPERLSEFAVSLPWLSFVQQKIREVELNNSNIRDYAATNSAEFFAVASEYFFERPKMLQQKHPKLYQYLTDFYQQNMAEMQSDLQPFKNSPCPCGSGKKYKRCCMKKA
ncbi:zinc-dependent peptidase [Thalassolituus oleivorans]|uniref:zinc-dependent peptidase n=1 Tax=Thalassolituus oleivorans TaxID=187493 RepID=UPI0023F2B864|nr:zinc-dependent peptidase [Thalassolituus oleivorans]